MSMYYLLESSKNYRKTTGSLYNYYRDELSDDADDNNFDNIKVVNSNTFKYKNNRWYARSRISYTIKIFR